MAAAIGAVAHQRADRRMTSTSRRTRKSRSSAWAHRGLTEHPRGGDEMDTTSCLRPARVTTCSRRAHCEDIKIAIARLHPASGTPARHAPRPRPADGRREQSKSCETDARALDPSLSLNRRHIKDTIEETLRSSCRLMDRHRLAAAEHSSRFDRRIASNADAVHIQRPVDLRGSGTAWCSRTRPDGRSPCGDT